MQRRTNWFGVRVVKVKVKCRRCGGRALRGIVERGEWHCIACGHRIPMFAVRSQLQAAATPLIRADFPWCGQKVLSEAGDAALG